MSQLFTNKSLFKLTSFGLLPSFRSMGFTLVELLVVIAVIGVLSTIVLIAVNPVEQINRAQDAGKKAQVAGIGRALQNYYTASGSGGSTPTYPLAASWSTDLTASQDLKTAPDTTVFTYVASSATVPNSGALVYVTVKSRRAYTDAAAAPYSVSCTYPTQTLYFYWRSGTNGIAYKCNAAPVAADI